MPNPTAQAQQQPSPTPWPPGVTARYVNQVGAPIDITGSGQTTYARCSGCVFGKSETPWTEAYTHELAQEHAERCRALPRPEALQ